LSNNVSHETAKAPKVVLNRKFITIAIAIVLVIAVVCILIFTGNEEKVIPPNANYGVLVMGQLDKNEYIADITYDPALTIENNAAAALASAGELKPIENNFFKRDKDNDVDLLYDELIVGRVIQFNSDWVAYCNTAADQYADEAAIKAATTAAEASIKDGSSAVAKLPELAPPGAEGTELAGQKTKVAYHRLTIGQIMQGEKGDFVILVREYYTLMTGGTQSQVDNVYLYTLSAKGKSMLITDFIKL
jgi:hypothetical protein